MSAIPRRPARAAAASSIGGPSASSSIAQPDQRGDDGDRHDGAARPARAGRRCRARAARPGTRPARRPVAAGRRRPTLDDASPSTTICDPHVGPVLDPLGEPLDRRQQPHLLEHDRAPRDQQRLDLVDRRPQVRGQALDRASADSASASARRSDGRTSAWRSAAIRARSVSAASARPPPARAPARRRTRAASANGSRRCRFRRRARGHAVRASARPRAAGRGRRRSPRAPDHREPRPLGDRRRLLARDRPTAPSAQISSALRPIATTATQTSTTTRLAAPPRRLSSRRRRRSPPGSRAPRTSRGQPAPGWIARSARPREPTPITRAPPPSTRRSPPPRRRRRPRPASAHDATTGPGAPSSSGHDRRTIEDAERGHRVDQPQ